MEQCGHNSEIRNKRINDHLFKKKIHILIPLFKKIHLKQYFPNKCTFIFNIKYTHKCIGYLNLFIYKEKNRKKVTYE